MTTKSWKPPIIAQYDAQRTYQMINSSLVSKGAMNSFKEMFPLARLFPLTVMHRGYRIVIKDV